MTPEDEKRLASIVEWYTRRPNNDVSWLLVRLDESERARKEAEAAYHAEQLRAGRLREERDHYRESHLAGVGLRERAERAEAALADMTVLRDAAIVSIEKAGERYERALAEERTKREAAEYAREEEHRIGETHRERAETAEARVAELEAIIANALT